MSLVRDALAKAEREAAARAAREQGLPAQLSALPQPYRSRRRARWPWAIGLAVAALAGAVVALVLLWPVGDSVFSPALRAPLPTPVAAPTPTLQETGKAPLKGEMDPTSVPEAAAAAVAPPAPASTRSSAAPASAPAARESVAAPASPSAATGAREEPREVPRSASGTAGSSATAAAGGSYVLEVGLGEGRAIRLGGIAWSEAAPLAYLNGRLVGVGEYVEGFRVVAIERDRVRFDGGDGRLELRFDVRLR